jgi:hypothetical protein
MKPGMGWGAMAAGPPPIQGVRTSCVAGSEGFGRDAGGDRDQNIDIAKIADQVPSQNHRAFRGLAEMFHLVRIGYDYMIHCAVKQALISVTIRHTKTM